MQLLDLTVSPGTLISAYESQGAYALSLGDGRGEGHVYRIRIEPGGAIGPHAAGFGQLFLVVVGRGWISVVMPCGTPSPQDTAPGSLAVRSTRRGATPA